MNSNIHMELPENELILFKRYIYLYFFLLLFEGALRRWFLPQFSDLLMVIRDPVALYLVFKALKNNVFSSNLYFYAILIETVISFFLTILIGHGNLLVALYGARILIIHFPLIFIIGSVFDSADVMKIGKLMIFLSIPMALLIIIQFYAPQTSFVNVGLAGNIEEVGFAGANGYYRPPGTFSFISGVNLFFGMASCFVFYALVNPIGIPKFWVYLALIAVILSIPFSISRTLFFCVSVSFCFFLYTLYHGRTYFFRILVFFLILSFLIFIFSDFPFIKTGIDTFSERFSTANEVEGGLVKGVIGDRFFGWLIEAISTADEVPFFGLGLGMGTNVGAKLLIGINSVFLIGEGEWKRIFGEMGLLLGGLFIFIRIAISLNLGLRSFREIKLNHTLPFILFSNVFIFLVQGQWTQPSILGFSVFFAGILLASLNNTDN